MTGLTGKMAALFAAITTALSGVTGNLPEAGTPSVVEEASIQDVMPLDICKEITIGWNLGNSLDATGMGLNSETSWGNPVVTEELILAVKDAGFNAVRIPVTWFNHCSGDYTVDSAWLDRVQEVVDYAYDNELYVIINAHHENFNFTSEDNYPKAKKALTTIWKQAAERFKDYGPRLLFEGQNEPRKNGTAVEWNGGDDEGRKVVNKLNADFVRTVRQTGGNNKYRCLIVPTYAASASALDGFKLPEDDRLIVSIHAYAPYNFAMNANGTDTFDPEKTSDTSELVWMSKKLYDDYISKGVGAIIGECGTINKNNLSERLNWAEYFPQVFGQYDIPIFLWDNNGYGTGNETFGLLHRDTLKWEYPKYIRTIVRSAEKAKG